MSLFVFDPKLHAPFLPFHTMTSMKGKWIVENTYIGGNTRNKKVRRGEGSGKRKERREGIGMIVNEMCNLQLLSVTFLSLAYSLSHIFLPFLLTSFPPSFPTHCIPLASDNLLGDIH